MKRPKVGAAASVQDAGEGSLRTSVAVTETKTKQQSEPGKQAVLPVLRALSVRYLHRLT